MNGKHQGPRGAPHIFSNEEEKEICDLILEIGHNRVTGSKVGQKPLVFNFKSNLYQNHALHDYQITQEHTLYSLLSNAASFIVISLTIM